tara:strand:+ start:3014 stop:3451 length:438 start_codon:yes stop_codon:yes gene_type:complete
MTSTIPNDYQSYLAQKEQVRAIKQARVRIGIAWVAHLVAAPISSLVYSIKTENYVPVLVATGVALVAVPLAAIDLGLTLAVAPPVTSAVLIQTKAGERRRQLGIFGPEQADVMMFGTFQSVPTKVEVNVSTPNPGVSVEEVSQES